MKIRSVGIVVFSLLFASAAFATTSATATLQISGTVVSSVAVSLATGSGGATLGGTATAATLNLGSTLARTSTVANWTKDTSSTTSYKFSTPVNVTIDAANTSSTAATVTAYLSGDPGTVVFSFGGTNVTGFTSGTANTISGTTYTLDGTTKNYSADNTVSVTIPDTLASGTDIGNTINLTVTVN